MYTKNNKTYVEFTLLNGEDVVGTTGIIDFDTITTTDTKNPIAGQDDVSVKYLWFCNIQVENGINVYAELPKTEDPTDPTEQPTEPTEPTTPEESETTETPEETKTSSESKEKDNTPKTGSANVALMATVVSAISLAGIVTVKKYTK